MLFRFIDVIMSLFDLSGVAVLVSYHARNPPFSAGPAISRLNPNSQPGLSKAPGSPSMAWLLVQGIAITEIYHDVLGSPAVVHCHPTSFPRSIERHNNHHDNPD
jgi:hypothetical protein